MCLCAHTCTHTHTHTHIHTPLNQTLLQLNKHHIVEPITGLSPQEVHLWPSGFGGFVMFAFQVLCLTPSFFLWLLSPIVDISCLCMWPWRGWCCLVDERFPSPFLLQKGEWEELVPQSGETMAMGCDQWGPSHHGQSLLDCSSVRETDQVTKCAVTFWRWPSHNNPSWLANHPHNTFHDCQRGWHRCVEGMTTLEMTSLMSEKSGNWLKHY